MPTYFLRIRSNSRITFIVFGGNYKSDEKIMKTLIHKNIHPTDPTKKNKTYYIL